MTQTERTEEQLARIRDFVTALRSGEYTQTVQQLGRVCDGARRYCCEGVAAERYAAHFDGWSSGWSDDGVLILTDDDGNEAHNYAEDEFWELLGLDVAEDDGNETSSGFAFVLPDELDDRQFGVSSISFMTLNDNGFTFAQIADLIEWQYLSCPAS